MKLLLIVITLTALIHLVNTLAYSMRLSGVRTRKIATAFSLYNVIFLAASTANSIQIPLVPAVVEREINLGGVQASFLSAEQLAMLQQQMRLILGAATLGTVLGAVLIPVFVIIFVRAIELFEEIGSVPKLMGRVLLSPRLLWSVTRDFPLLRSKPLPDQFPPPQPIPLTFIVLNALVAGIYTTGVLSSIYAGALFPEARKTAISLAPVINGVATVLAAAIVDPTASNITDQTMRGERCEADVEKMNYYLALSRIVGTVFAQALFLPAAHLIKYTAILLTN